MPTGSWLVNLLPAVTPPKSVSVQPEVASPNPDDFHVHLENFSGPFDLLLSLISKHKMDITEVALATVTDEFIAYIRMADFDEVAGNTLLDKNARRNLGLASEFLLIAATLLDLKAARLLPTTDQDTEDALELLEARDVLFTKLLQYRAFKHLSQEFSDRLDQQSTSIARATALDPALAGLLPPLVWTLTPSRLSQLAQHALGDPQEAAPPRVSVTHLHGASLSVADEAPTVITKLRAAGTMTFSELVAETDDQLVVVVRFLILLELFREAQITFQQVSALAPLSITWVGSETFVAYTLDDYVGFPVGTDS